MPNPITTLATRRTLALRIGMMFVTAVSFDLTPWLLSPARPAGILSKIKGATPVAGRDGATALIGFRRPRPQAETTENGSDLTPVSQPQRSARQHVAQWRRG
jgi:hypothetical protein